MSCSSTPPLRLVDAKGPSSPVLESGYVSASSSTPAKGLPLISLTQHHIRFLNQQLERLAPIERLRLVRLMFPNLYQSTAFGLTGLVTLDMLSKIHAEDPSAPSIDLIFLDTLYHFDETYDLVDRVKSRYLDTTIHIFRPDGISTVAEFEEQYGPGLYDIASEMYDWIAKVEPLQRAYVDLRVAAVLTGRRRSQGGQRDKIGIIEVEDETGIIKINPLVDWSFQQVQSYIKEHNVPYNDLLDRGYKSVGDWHSTSPVKEGEDERAGRWKGQTKTECGIHNKKSRYAQFLEEMARKEQEDKSQEEQQRLTEALEEVERTRRVEASSEEAR